MLPSRCGFSIHGLDRRSILSLQQGYLLKVGLCGVVAKEPAVNSPSLQCYLGTGLAQVNATKLEVKMQISAAWFDSPCPNLPIESPR